MSWLDNSASARVAVIGIALACAVLAACSNTSDRADPALTTVAAASTTSAVGTTEATEPEAEAQPGDTAAVAPTLSGALTATVIDTHPHDEGAFTQGLEIFEGQFVEGTGLYGESDRRIVDINSGDVVMVQPIDDELFGEGLTIVGDEILQVTWKAGVAIRSDAQTLAEIERIPYEGEGWGICFDGETLAMSNGSSSLTFREADTFEAVRSVEVTMNGNPVELLNELECVNGQVLANVWLSDLIVVIDPATGSVVASFDGSSLRPGGLPLSDSGFALNGIAYDSDTGHFFLTGKRWPVIYEVELS